MAINHRDFLIKNAEAFAAGKVLGMTENEVFAQLQKIQDRAKKGKEINLNEVFLDKVMRERLGGLDDSLPSGKQILTAARRRLNAERRASGRKGQPTQAMKNAALEEELNSLMRTEIAFRRAKEEDPTTLLRDPNAALKGTNSNVDAVMDGEVQKYEDYVDGDGIRRRADGSLSTGDEGEFTRTRGRATPDYDGSGYYDPTEDPNFESALKRYTYSWKDDAGNTKTRVYSENETIPQEIREKAAVYNQLYGETYPRENFRVSSPVQEDAKTGEETDVYRAAPYDAKDEFNAYLVRREDGSVIRYSRTADNQLVEDPNGTITIKRVLSGGDAHNYEPVVQTDRDGNVTITGARINKDGEVIKAPQEALVQDIGVGSGSRVGITPERLGIVEEIARRAGEGTLPSAISVSSGFQDPRFRDAPMSVTGRLTDGSGEPNRVENMYYQKNKAGGAPIRVFPSVTADGELVGSEAQRLIDRGELVPDAARNRRDADYIVGREVANRTPRVSVGGLNQDIVDEIYARGYEAEIEELDSLLGLKEEKTNPNARGARGQGYAVKAFTPTEEIELRGNFPGGGRYGYDSRGDIVVYGDNEPDSVVLEEMGRYSPESIERSRRVRAVGEVLGELRDTTPRKNPVTKQTETPEILSEEKENALLAKRLGVSLEEAVVRKAEFKQAAGMGQSPEAFVRDYTPIAMQSGELEEVDIGASLKKLETAIDRVMPEGQSFGPIRTTADAMRALKLYQQYDRTQRPLLKGEAVRRLTDKTRLPTIQTDNYTPTVDEVIEARIARRDQLQRVVDNINSEGLGSNNGSATWADITRNTGVSVDELKRISVEGKEALAAREQINAVGLENAQLSESIKREISTPVQGGFLETVGMMKEFDAKGTKQLAMALQQMKAAEESGINQSRKDMFVETGRSLIDTDVQTNRIRESEKAAQQFAESAKMKAKGGTIALEPGTPDVYSVVTEDGSERLEPYTRKDGRMASPAQIPIKVNADGSVMEPTAAVEIERAEIAGWTNYSEEQKEQRLAILADKQQRAFDAVIVRPDEMTFEKLPRQAGAVKSYDTSNAGMQEANLISQERAARDDDGAVFFEQQQAPVTEEAKALAQLRAERGNLDEGVPRLPAPTGVESDYVVPRSVKNNSSIPVQLKGQQNPNDPLINALSLPSSRNQPEAFGGAIVPVSRPVDPRPIIDPRNAGMTPRDLAIQSEANSRFVIPDANPRTRAYNVSADKDVVDLPPVTRPQGAEEPGTFIDANTGERRTYGGTYDGPTDKQEQESYLADPFDSEEPRPMVEDPWASADPIARAQAPDVVTPNYNVEMPPSLPPAKASGSVGKEVTARREEKAKKPPQNRRNPFNRRNLGIGAAGSGLVAAGAGIGSLINNERQAREEQR